MTVGKGASTREIDVTDLAALQSTHDDFPDDVEPGYVPPQPEEPRRSPPTARSPPPTSDPRCSAKPWCARFFCQEGGVALDR